LYAHWEGATKNIAHYYLCYVSSLRLPYNKLKDNFYAISLKSELDQFPATSKASLHTHIISSVFAKYPRSSQIPQEGVVKTDSNLSSSVFSEIAHAIGIDISAYAISFTHIDDVLLSIEIKQHTVTGWMR
jgi:hypothetical protein